MLDAFDKNTVVNDWSEEISDSGVIAHTTHILPQSKDKVGNLSLYVAKLFSPFHCPNTYPVAVSRIRNESVT